MRPLLAYALHSGNLYGTERMGLETAAGLSDAFDPVILAPEGPALVLARQRGMTAIPFTGSRDVAAELWRLLAPRRDVAFFATGLVHSAAFLAVNAVRRRRTAHLHMVHGGTDERLSYGRKKLLNHAPVTLVAVSSFVKERLLAHGVDEGKVRVVENFAPDALVETCPKRPAGGGGSVMRAVAVSRVDPIKRLDLLLDAVEGEPLLADLSVRVFGTGWQLDEMRVRAAERCPNVRFEGFSAKVPEELAASDLLVHTCPEEPFGLAILEAFAAGVPVLVPDSGGAGSLVTDGVDGFRFRASDAPDLRRRLIEIRALPPERRAAVVEGARAALAGRFSARRGIAEYRALVEEAFG